MFQCIVNSPLLGRLGNSNMPRNPDSSRFGKLYRIYFDKQSKMMTGCSITPYMLEKSRVSAQQQGERNFHMFYRMMCDPVDLMEFEKVAGNQDKAAKLIKDDLTVAEDAKSSPGQVTYFEEGGKKMLGLSPEKRAMCLLPPPGQEGMESFTYLMGGSVMNGAGAGLRKVEYERMFKDIPEQDRIFKDAFNMSNMMQSFHNFFTDDEIDTILRTVAGVLWLGEVLIEPEPGEDPVKNAVGVFKGGRSGEGLSKCAQLWQVDPELLADACYKMTIDLGRQGLKQTVIQDSAGGYLGAVGLRDGVARFVYDEMFKWVIGKCSSDLAQDAKPDRELYLGVLDIFGFEFYQNDKIEAVDCKVVNGLDQLNINMCNELLQQEFVRVIFGLEIAAYAEQGHNFSFDDFDDNEPACLWLKEPRGPLLQALSKPAAQKKVGKDADVLFLETLKKMSADCLVDGDKYKAEIAKGNDLVDPKKTVMYTFPTKGFGASFNGIHGGQYGAYGERGKNNATWKANLDSINESFNPKSRNMSPAFGVRHYAAEVSYDCRGWLQKDKAKPAVEMTTVLGQSQDSIFMKLKFDPSQWEDVESGGVTAQFAASLEALLQELGNTDMNFVRCLKTSDPLSKGTFQSALVLKQLKYTGMLDTLNIRRFGFPQRMTPQEFVDAYKLLAPEVTLPGYSDTGEPPSQSDILAAATSISKTMHDTYMEQVFNSLPPSDRANPKMQAQKSETVVVGKPARADIKPLVMMRDWFQRGTQRIAFEQLRAFADTTIVGLQKKFYCETFILKRKTLKDFAPMLRALAQRSPYLSTKWTTLDSTGKLQLSEKLRAHAARVEYTMLRNEHYEARMKQNLVAAMAATLHRQQFYEAKMKYLEKEKTGREIRRLRGCEQHSTEYMADLLEEQEHSQMHLQRMRDEEEHADNVLMAKEMAKGNLIKERCLLMASHARRKAATAIERVQAIEIEARKHEWMLQKHGKAIQQALLVS